jgi:hypothetical protein
MKCPYCRTGIHERAEAWFPILYRRYDVTHEKHKSAVPATERTRDPFERLAFYYRAHQCFECEKVCIEFARRLERNHEGGDTTVSTKAFVAWPQTGTRLPQAFPNAQNEVPTIYADYQTACRLLDVSESASAAFARKCMERILIHHFEPQKDKKGRYPQLNQLLIDLVGPINEPRSNPKVPSNVAQRLHLVREYGNFGIHTTEDHATGEVLEVERDEAEACLKTVEAMFDAFFEEPVRLKAMKRRHNDKLDRAKRPKHRE